MQWDLHLLNVFRKHATPSFEKHYDSHRFLTIFVISVSADKGNSPFELTPSDVSEFATSLFDQGCFSSSGCEQRGLGDDAKGHLFFEVERCIAASALLASAQSDRTMASTGTSSWPSRARCKASTQAGSRWIKISIELRQRESTAQVPYPYP